jgi:hypothetical protein
MADLKLAAGFAESFSATHTWFVEKHGRFYISVLFRHFPRTKRMHGLLRQEFIFICI